jgi:NADH-quinone oxidoreductase subunit N
MNALYVICGLGVASLVAELVHLKKWLIPFLVLGIAVAAVIGVRDWNASAAYFQRMVIIDNVAIAFNTLICVIAFFWFWMANDYFHKETHVTDQAALVLFVIVGGMVLTSFNNMAMLFLGIEILSLSLYVLAGSRKESLLSNEAAFKYFLMGSFATGFLLMGIALVYGATGFFHLDKIAGYIQAHPDGLPGFFYAGVLLIVVGMAFKVSAVPFHFWAPDVYEGSPTVITALMSTVVKVAAFAAFFRLLAYCFPQVHSSVHLALLVITVLTLVVGNITAVYQINVKRMLAYSSVGHAGYILLALVAGGRGLGNAIFYYLAAYSAATLAAFAVLALIEQQGSASVDSFDGLFKRNPFLALAMSIALLSLAGIPPLAGFLGKYMVFSQAISQGYLNLVILGVITSLIGVFYYFRVIGAMFFKEPPSGTLALSLSVKILLAVLMVLSLAMGIFPNLVLVL